MKDNQTKVTEQTIYTEIRKVERFRVLAEVNAVLDEVIGENIRTQVSVGDEALECGDKISGEKASCLIEMLEHIRKEIKSRLKATEGK